MEGISNATPGHGIRILSPWQGQPGDDILAHASLLSSWFFQALLVKSSHAEVSSGMSREILMPAMGFYV